MDELIYQGLPVILSACQIAMLWLAGSKNRLAWWLGLWMQIPWTYYNLFVIHAYGFLALSAAMVVVNVRNLRKWR